MTVLTLSYRVIFGSLLAMIIAAVLLYFDTAALLAYAMLLLGFFGIGIGILIGFFNMVREDQTPRD